ncbi:MAG: hypothetical protein ACXU9U_05780 [Parachlamydiaceae bacterium]
MHIFNSCASTIESYFSIQTRINNIVTSIVKAALEALQFFVEAIRSSYQCFSNLFEKITPITSQSDALSVDQLQQQIVQLKKRVLDLEAGVEVATLFFEDLDEPPVDEPPTVSTSHKEIIALKKHNKELEDLNIRLERRNMRLNRQIDQLENYKNELSKKNMIYLETIDEQEEIMQEYEDELLAKDEIIYDLNEFYEKVTTFQKVESPLRKKINSKIPQKALVEDKENCFFTPQKGRNRVNSTPCAEQTVSVLNVKNSNIFSPELLERSNTGY